MAHIAGSKEIEEASAAGRIFLDEILRINRESGKPKSADEHAAAIQSGVSVLLLIGSERSQQPNVVQAVGFALGAAFGQWDEAAVAAQMVLDIGIGQGYDAVRRVMTPGGNA